MLETSYAEPSAGSPRPTLVPQSFALSEKGPVRESNEDQFLVARLTKAVRIQQSSLPQSMMKCGDDEGRARSRSSRLRSFSPTSSNGFLS
jgi:hypothetical protein